MLAGEVPHAGPSPQVIMSNVMTAEARSITAHRPLVPAHIAAAIHTALARVPSERFADADAFIAALEQTATRKTSLRGRVTAGGHVTTRLTVIAVAALLLGGVLGWVLRGVLVRQ